MGITRIKFNPGSGIEKILWLGVLIIFWEIIAHSGMVSPLLLPPLETILLSLKSELLNGSLLAGTLRSLALVFGGIGIGFILAAVLSILALLFPVLRSLVEVLIAVMHPLPGIALLPVVILFFGVGTGPVFFIILHSVLWPMCINIISGFENIPPLLIKIGKNYELKPIQFFFRIMLPAAFPPLLAGLRIAWARSWRALISAEMLFGVSTGKGGIGWYVFNKRVFMDTPGMYAGLLVLIIIGLVVETGIFRKMEGVTIRRWSPSE